jgi:hypothetical protein
MKSIDAKREEIRNANGEIVKYDKNHMAAYVEGMYELTDVDPDGTIASTWRMASWGDLVKQANYDNQN